VRRLTPDPAKLAARGGIGEVLAMAPGTDPDAAVELVVAAVRTRDRDPEDPVTRGNQCGLTPFWPRDSTSASPATRQVSARGGELICVLAGDRVWMAGTPCW
jgi:hypothetical protein